MGVVTMSGIIVILRRQSPFTARDDIDRIGKDHRTNFISVDKRRPPPETAAASFDQNASADRGDGNHREMFSIPPLRR
jgi:hypothetical protein